VSHRILLRLYKDSGRQGPIRPGFRGIACLDPDNLAYGFSVFFHLPGPLSPGEAISCEVDFLCPESETRVLRAGRFLLLEPPRLTGEAKFI
jgi:hypothetical protein